LIVKLSPVAVEVGAEVGLAVVAVVWVGGLGDIIGLEQADAKVSIGRTG